METLNLYCLASREHFAPFVGEDETELVRSVRASCGDEYAITQRGIWCMARPSSVTSAPESGWKLHVSLSLPDYQEGLALCVGLLSVHRAPFKFIADPKIHELSHSPWWPRSQSGKDVVVYPRHPDEARALGRGLSGALAHLAPGPQVLSDLPLPGTRHVHYRYGAFERRLRCEPDGSHTWLLSEQSEVEDERNPWYDAPTQVDPLVPAGPDPRGQKGSSQLTLAGRYQPVSAIKFTNAGGVYRARDLVRGGTVIIKEARPGVIYPRTGWTAQSVLRREHDRQAQLELGELFVDPVELFEQEGHVFSVQEDVGPVQHLGQWSIAHNPVYSQTGDFESYLTAYWSLIRGVAAALDRVHRQGVAMGDVSFTNVLIEDGRPRVVDFGAAYRPGAEAQPGIYTRGLGSYEKALEGFERDVKALGYLILGGFILPAGIAELDPEAPTRMAELVADEWGGHEILAIAQTCLDADASSAAGILQALLAANPSYLSSSRPTVRATATRPSVVAVIGSLSTPDSDTLRLSPLAYERHPGSMAWGSGGPLFVLGAIGADVPPARYARWLTSVRASAPGLPPGLYTGWAGVAETALTCADPDTADWAIERAIEGSAELIDFSYWQGLAGISIACLDVAGATGNASLIEQAEILATRAYSTYDRTPATARRHGLAYGSAGLLLTLCQAPLSRVIDRTALAELARAATTSATPTPAGHLSCIPDPDRPRLFRHYLNDGTAGLTSALTRYYAISRCEATRETIELLLPDVDRLLTATPALWTGFSGLGMSLLDVAATLQRDDLRDAGSGIADRLGVFQISGHAGFPGEQNLRLSDDLVAGTSGVLAFLWRAQEPLTRPNILPGFGR